MYICVSTTLIIKKNNNMNNSEFLKFLDEYKSNEPNETPEPVELTDEQKLWYYHEQEQEERAHNQQQH